MTVCPHMTIQENPQLDNIKCVFAYLQTIFAIHSSWDLSNVPYETGLCNSFICFKGNAGVLYFHSNSITHTSPDVTTEKCFILLAQMRSLLWRQTPADTNK